MEPIAAMSNGELVQAWRKNGRDLFELLGCPAPTADAALDGYEREIAGLQIEGDELADELGRRGLWPRSRREAQ